MGSNLDFVWNDGGDEVLRAHHNKIPLDEIAIKLGVSVNAVINRKAKLGLVTKQIVQAQPARNLHIVAMRQQGASYAQIANKFGVTKNVVAGVLTRQREREQRNSRNAENQQRGNVGEGLRYER